METITTAQAAGRLGVPVSTFHAWVQSGRIAPAFKAPGKRGAYFFTIDAVDALRPAKSAV